MNSQVPTQESMAAAPATSAPKESSWLDDAGDFQITPDLDLRSLWTAIKGAPETGLAMANNTAAAGVAGLTAPFVTDGSTDDAADYTRDFMEHNSYTPQGDSARELTGAIGDAFAPYEHGKQQLGDTIMEHTGSPALATAGYMGPDLATILMGPKPAAGKYGTTETGLGPITAKTKAPPSDLTNVGDVLDFHREQAPPVDKGGRMDPQDPVKTARSAGYKLLPSQVEQATLKKPGLGDRIAEAIAPEDVRRDFTIDNQGVTQGLARDKLKAPEGASLDETGLDAMREPHYQAYRDVEKAVEVVPPSEDYMFALDDATQRAKFKKGAKPSVTEVISALRTKARKKLNNPNADETIAQDGAADRDAADALEEALGKRLGELGDNESLTKYQNARKSLAEINDIDEAQQGGIVDAGKVKRKDDKTQKRLTGQSKMMADVNASFPDATKSSLSVAGRKGSTHLPESREGVVKKVAKAAARGAAKVTGLGDRLLVESEGFQNRMGKPATPVERTYFEDYGKKGELVSSPGAVDPEKGLDFAETPGVTPSKAVTLSRRLGLEPDAVDNPDALPETPDKLTADTPPATESRGMPFKASRLGDDLAGDTELDIRSGTKGAVGQKELADLLADQRSDGLEVAPPREMEQLDLKAGGEPSNRLQLTKSPKGAGKITAARDKSGNVTVRHEDGGEITAIELPDQGRMQIKDSKVPADARGQGRGQAMTRQLLSMAKKKGLQLVSDNRVSESAQAMWTALKKKGLNVRQNPATRQTNGELVSKSELKPVFEILDDAVPE